MKISKPFVLIGILAACLYFSIAVFLLNPALVVNTLFAPTSFLSKASLFFALLESSWDVLSHLDFTLLTITSLLVGWNISLSFMLLKRLKSMGKINFAVGGGTMLGVFSTGCASCGFSAFSLFGASGTVAFFPLRGSELYALAISLLLVSLYYNIKNLQKPLVCQTTPLPINGRAQGTSRRRK